MKLFKSLAVAGVGVFCLTSCNTHAVRHPEGDYYRTLSWNGYNENKAFHILQLTDLHISNMSDNEKQFKFIKKTVDKAKEKAGNIDLIIITGDLFTFANKSNAIATFDFFDDLGIPWAPTWGNHDEQNYFSVSWLTSELNNRDKDRVANKKSHCVFVDQQDDDIFGNANYVINLMHGGSKVPVEQLFIFDSNRYNYGEYFGYDYIHNDQIDWYERIVTSNSKLEGDKIVATPSLAFFHIPFMQFDTAWQLANKGADPNEACFIDDNQGERHGHETSTGAPKKETKLFDKMVTLGSTKGVFVGHNHESSYLVKYNPNKTPNGGIYLCCGIKSTNKVYCDENFLGGQIINLHKGGEFDIDRIITSYKEI